MSGNEYIRSAGISPTGARVAFEYRGEVVTVPAEKGDPRNITNSAGANDRSPAWSPDGKSIAWFSDETGEYKLYIGAQDGDGEPRVLDPAGAGFYSAAEWSPDGKYIAYQDNSQSVYVMDVKSGRARRIAGNQTYTPLELVSGAWSPDSRWYAYTVDTHPLVTTLFVYNVEDQTSRRITDGLSAVSEPAFDRSGKYLYVIASTDAGPVLDWFAQSNTNLPSTASIYAVVLRNDLPNPFAAESDEEPGATNAADTATAAATAATTTAKADGAAAKSDRAAANAETRIDFDGIEQRIVALPLPAADIANLMAGAPGMVFYTRSLDGDRVLHRYDMEKRKDDIFLPDTDVGGYVVSADGKKLLYTTNGNWFVAAATAPKPTAKRLATNDIRVRIVPREEWKQIFEEAWRINRDYFYAPNMHGVDWNAARSKYEPLLADAVTKADVNRVIQWMMSELSVGHHRGGGGDRLESPPRVAGGLLGADYEVDNGRYRFAKVYGGLNWTPGLRAPLTEPGVHVDEGEYLLAVNGVDVRAPANLYSFFENTAGRSTSITVGPNPDGRGARTLDVVPIASESALRNREWVDSNVRMVDSLSNGRIAYVYVPNTAQPGYDYFKRYFYPQAHKDGIVVDERDNGGGSIADYYIDILRRPLISYWAMRYGADMRTPAASIQGPKALIVNEMAGSGGDLFPWMWRKYDLGPIIGQRTWGGLVGILGFPTLMDGGSITAPNLAIWTPEGGWVVENEGVPPDIEVEQTPAAVLAGHDPQLEKAVEVVMAELKANPPKTPVRPPYPIKKD